MVEQVPLFEIDWDISDIHNVIDSISRGSYWAKGPYVDEFEQALSTYFEREHTVVFNSGTSALIGALTTLELNPTDEVIVPSFTFIATANAVRLAGATPVFADIERETLGLDPDDVRERITDNTVAILPVHVYGAPCQISELRSVANENDLILIEDAAEAHGATYDGKKVGTFGEMGVLSFCQNKIVPTGEGGAVLTDDNEFAQQLRLFQSHGRPENDYFGSSDSGEYISLGGNYRMPDIVAALGCSQQSRVESIIERRRNVAETLNEGISSIDGVHPCIGPERGEHVYQLYTIVLGEMIDRPGVINSLKERGISSKIYWDPAIHQTEYYRESYGLIPELPVTEALSNRVLSLPMYPGLTPQAITRIISALEDAVAHATSK